VDELIAIVRDAYEQNEALYPVGGGTSLEYGRPVQRPGRAVHLKQLNRVVDYPARDMTITVQAGITIATLQELLATEGQQFPIDVPHPDRATLGGVIATNWNGPRRLGYGNVRDYVIGIRAIDGRGELFSGGGRVVKNVAGYDFSKLLTGSLGTLGIIVEVTLKLKPRPASQALVVCAPDNHQQMERLLSALALGPVPAVSVDWLGGPEWTDREPWRSLPDPFAENTGWLAVGLDGTGAEVDWQVSEVGRQWNQLGIQPPTVWHDEQAGPVWRDLSTYPDLAPAALVVQMIGVPSGTGSLVAAAQRVDPGCSFLAHAGSGVVLVRYERMPAGGLSRALTGELGMAAARAQGYVQIVSNPDGAEMTSRMVWGGADLPSDLLGNIKRQFDPHLILNPQRFVYHESS
jgi:glycolate oxidase FAD binding subunit